MATIVGGVRLCGVSADEPWVEVVAHGGGWAESYRAEAAVIRAKLGDYVLGVEHFGSTAVPGLFAKPIIDILVGTQPGGEPHTAIDALGQISRSATFFVPVRTGSNGMGRPSWMLRQQLGQAC